MTPSKRKLALGLQKSRSYRHKLVAEHIQRSPAIQIRALRESRRLTQTQLAQAAGVRQSWISDVEKPDREGFNLSTLKKLAEAFDVALIVRFVPFSQFTEWIDRLDEADLAPPPFDQDAALWWDTPSGTGQAIHWETEVTAAHQLGLPIVASLAPRIAQSTTAVSTTPDLEVTRSA